MPKETNFDLVKRFLEEGWIEGWGLSYYQNTKGKSELGQLVYDCKYQFGNKTLEERIITAELLREVVKDFIHKQYPVHVRPFNAIITPPGNLKKPFDLTKYIAGKLQSGNIHDYSPFIFKKKELPSMKTLSIRQRKEILKDAFEIKGTPSNFKIKGFLVFDDILDSGATAHAICDTLERYFPGVPRYYLAITYLGDGK